ncbi:LysR family transcriptional regulator [Bacillota bacterium Meth-B3]|nr:LysR family transcriptional regulator [Christensenellaceae bacterium]MEA5066496.1 LysR family transcriptional regulator [Eubacteriales bacterium]MEA5068687.1 LysR family transcriptional regulator [Christensenellaceae bacterium]
MEDRALIYLEKILEEGSVSLAAKRLYIAQPSLSQYIKRIENDLGAEIFERNARPAKLTAAGEIFLQTERSIHQLRQQRKSQIDDLLEIKTGRLTIGSSNYRSMYLLTTVLPVFKQRYPGIRINLEEGITEKLEECATRGITDFSIVLLPLSDPELTYEELFQEEIVLALPAKHRLCNAEDEEGQFPPYPSIDFSLLKEESFIVMKKGQKLRTSFFDLCHGAGFRPNIILQTDSMATAQALAAAGVGITIIPDILAMHNEFPQMPRYFSFKQHVPPRRVVVAYSKRRPLTGAARAFIRVMKEVVDTWPGRSAPLGSNCDDLQF